MERWGRSSAFTSQHSSYDNVVIGAGPNGLAAAITLVQSGRSVLVIEGKDTPGGGVRSGALTLPGYVHDICSAIHPLGAASPFFRQLGLEKYGLQWVYSPAEIAHPLDDGSAVLFMRSVEETSRNMGPDAAAYRRLMGTHVAAGSRLIDQFLGPLRIPARPVSYAWFGLQSLLPASVLARLAFRGERARAAFAGLAAHSMMPLDWPGTGGFGLMLGLLAHTGGYPMAKGGSQKIIDALVAQLNALGGELVVGKFLEDMEDLPPHRNILFDITPRQILQICGDKLPEGYRKGLERFRYGPGTFKVDYALDGPISWKAQECYQAATVHLGGSLEEIEAGERAVWRGEIPEQPFVLLAQQSLFDPTRAPAGKHTVWAYCHTPNGYSGSMLDQIENQIERFAPGFGSRVLARHTTNAQEMEQYNPNYIGGDINGGVQDLRQFFTRPVARWNPYTMPVKGFYICSSSTPPGGGVHGMCGYFAAQAVLGARRR